MWAPAGHRTGAKLRHHRLGLASSQWCENRAPPNNAQKYLQPQQRLAVVARQQHPSGGSQIVRTRAGPRTGAQLRHSRWVWHPSQRSNKPDTASKETGHRQTTPKKYLQPQQRLAVVARQQHPSGESQIVRTRAGPRTGAQLRHSRWVWHPSQRSNKPDTAKQKKKKKKKNSVALAQ